MPDDARATAPPPPTLHRWLEAHGYTVRLRADTWVEVVAWHANGEQHRGLGDTETDAWRALERSLFPTAAAQQLWQASQTSAPAVAETATVTVTPTDTDTDTDTDTVSDADANANANSWDAETWPDAGAELESSSKRTQPTDVLDGQSGPCLERATITDTATLTVTPLPANDPEADFAAAMEAEAPPAKPAPLELKSPSTALEGARSAPCVVERAKLEDAKPLDRSEAVDDLRLVRERISDLGPALALASAPLQKLQMLAWMARARDIDQRCADNTVARSTEEIAHVLGLIARRWWPGSVSALRLDCSPEKAFREARGYARELRIDGPFADGEACGRWGPLADLIDEALALRSDESNDGWADDGAQQPEDLDPDARLDRVRRELEGWTGPLANDPTKGGARTNPREWNKQRLASVARLARQLRWIRGSTTSDIRWADAFGRVRWIADRASAKHKDLADAINPRYRPPRGWPALLGLDPKRQEQETARDALLAEGAPDDIDALEAWLRRALTLPREVFPPVDIATALEPVAKTFDALGQRGFKPDGRADRKRLGRVTEARSKMHGGSRQLAASMQEEARKKTEQRAQRAAAEAEAAAHASAALDQLVQKVRAEVEGKTAVFCGNRADPELEQALSEALGLQLHWEIVTQTRRLDATAERVRQGGYDLVLAATGFIGHDADGKLGRACRASKPSVPFVRVDKGRLAATSRAIARTLGLRIEGIDGIQG